MELRDVVLNPGEASADSGTPYRVIDRSSRSSVVVHIQLYPQMLCQNCIPHIECGHPFEKRLVSRRRQLYNVYPTLYLQTEAYIWLNEFVLTVNVF